MSKFRDNAAAAAGRLASLTDAAPEALPSAPSRTSMYEGRSAHREACKLQCDRIVPDPDQPRQEFEAGSLETLARSLKERGQLQPIRVRWDEGRGVYVVVSGERRWRAAQQAGLAWLDCVVTTGNETPEEILEAQLIENCIREDLKPVEQARAFRTLMSRLGINQKELADRLHLSPASVTNAMALLTLPEAVRNAVDAGSLPASTACEIAKLDGPEEQAELAAAAVASEMTRAEVAAIVKERNPSKRAEKPRPNRCEYVFDRVHIKISHPPDVPEDVVNAAIRQTLAARKAGGKGSRDAA